MTPRSDSGVSSRWEQLIAGHAKASARYRAISAGAAASRSAFALEDQAEKALLELTEIESLALATPAEDAASLRFKMSLWGDGRVDGFEDEWRVFTEDCERILLEKAKERRRA